MKNWRIIITSIASFVLLSLALVQTSCVKNPCKNIECRNNGTCREGVCSCVSGYEGAFCQSQLSDKFIGTWIGYVRLNGGIDSNVNVIIAPGADSKTISIYNLFKESLLFTATVSLSQTEQFTIPQATTGTNFNYTVSGNGYEEKDKYIHIYYELTDPSGTTNTAYFEGTKFIAP